MTMPSPQERLFGERVVVKEIEIFENFWHPTVGEDLQAAEKPGLNETDAPQPQSHEPSKPICDGVASYGGGPLWATGHPGMGSLLDFALRQTIFRTRSNRLCSDGNNPRGRSSAKSSNDPISYSSDGESIGIRKNKPPLNVDIHLIFSFVERRKKLDLYRRCRTTGLTRG